MARAKQDGGLQNRASIQGEGWNRVESAERDVDVAQPRQGYGEEAWVCAAANRHGNEIKHNAQDQARQGADKGDQGLRTGELVSLLKRATPPNSHTAIPSTFTPRRTAPPAC